MEREHPVSYTHLIGNHEFDFDVDNMARIFKMADFPVVCANYNVWRYTAQKEVFVCRGKEKIEANIVLKLCEYKGYSAIYAVIDYGFENSDVWEQTSEAWLNIKNSQTPEALPEATLGVTVTGKGLPDPILTVCSFYPNIFDLQYQKGISFAEEKFSFK